MKIYLTKVISLALLTFTASMACADSYEEYSSPIEGLGLWWLDSGTQVVKRLSFRSNPEFATYCDGKNKLFIYELDSEEFTCRTDQSLDNRWHAEGQSSEEDQSDEYFVSLQNSKGDSQDIYTGIFTVSKKKLLRGNWDESAPTKSELKASAKLATINLKKIERNKDEEYKTVLGYDDKKICEEIAGVCRDKSYTTKITVKKRRGNLEIILLPTLYKFKEMGGDFISTVVAHDQNGYRFIGHISGCLLSIGADIDSDGVPEVLFENCDSGGLYQRIEYIKLFPKIETIMTYDHS